MNGYHKAILDACDCPQDDLRAVEEVMRARNCGVLDSLRPTRFDSEARIAWEILQILRAEEPEVAAMFDAD